VLGIDQVVSAGYVVVCSIGRTWVQMVDALFVSHSLVFPDGDSLKFTCQCEKKLVMKRVILRDKKEASSEQPGGGLAFPVADSSLASEAKKSIGSTSTDQLQYDLTLPTSGKISVGGSTSSDHLDGDLTLPKRNGSPDKSVCSLDVGDNTPSKMPV